MPQIAFYKYFVELTKIISYQKIKTFCVVHLSFHKLYYNFFSVTPSSIIIETRHCNTIQKHRKSTPAKCFQNSKIYSGINVTFSHVILFLKLLYFMLLKYFVVRPSSRMNTFETHNDDLKTSIAART